MTDISSNLEMIITKLDGMTSEVVEKQYGTDIASRVEHISKQLDFVEGGGGSTGGVMIVHANGEANGEALDKTWQEIYDAMKSGTPVMINEVAEQGDYLSAGNYWVIQALFVNNSFKVIADIANNTSDVTEYSANSSNGYPIYENIN